MNARVMAAVLLLPVAVAIQPVFAQGRADSPDKGCEMVWISGAVDSVDWVGNKFSVQLGGYSSLYAGLGGVQLNMPLGLRFLVTRDTRFVQQANTLSFVALAQFDTVSVLFCKDNFVDPVAIRVIITNPYPKN